MPEVSQIEWIAQLASACGLCSAVAGVGGYLVFRENHRRSLSDEKRLKEERLANEAKLLAAVRAAQVSPGPVDVIWTAEKATAPYSTQSRPTSPVPAFVPTSPIPTSEVFTAAARDTTETMVNPPMFQRPTRHKPSPSPLADTAARLRWADFVGPELVEKLTTTDVLHLETITEEGGEDRSASVFHGFQPATA